MASSFIYPGQQLLVPDKSGGDGGDGTIDESDESNNGDGGSTRGKRNSSDDIPSDEKGKVDLL